MPIPMIDGFPISAVTSRLRQRCVELGLGAWQCRADGSVEGQVVGPDAILEWLRSTQLRQKVQESLHATVAGTAKDGHFAQAVCPPQEIFKGCWLIVTPVIHKARRWGLVASLALHERAIDSEDFLQICHDGGLDPHATAVRARPHLYDSATAIHAAARTLRWAAEDIARHELDLRTLDEFSEKLAQAYEETNLLFSLGRLLSGAKSPRELMQLVCQRLHQTMPFAWIGIQFNFTGKEISEVAGQFILAGHLPCSQRAFDAQVQPLLEKFTKNDRMKLLSPAAPIRPLVQTTAVASDTNQDSGHSSAHDRHAPWLTMRSGDHSAAPTSLADLVRSEVVATGLYHDDQVIGVLLAGNKIAQDHDVSSFETKMLEAAAAFLGVFHENLARFAEQRLLFMGTLQALIASIDAKDAYTSGHSERVALLAAQLAAAIGMSATEQEQCHIAGIVHDVGKIGVPESVLGKPGKLTPAEFQLVKRHPKIGYDILKDIALLQPMLPGVLHHHERWDGKGYPQGLAGQDIPLIARVLTLADAFDAMSSNRAYRPAMPRARVLEEIRRGTGTQFDPSLAPIFSSMDFSSYDSMLESHRLVFRQTG